MIVPQIIATCSTNPVGRNTQILSVVTHSTIYNMILGEIGQLGLSTSVNSKDREGEGTLCSLTMNVLTLDLLW